MNIALISLGTKSMDSILAILMFAGVAVTALAVCFLLGRHQNRKRKVRKLARNHVSNNGKNHKK